MILAAVLLAAMAPLSHAADQVTDIQSEGERRIDENRAAQQAIDLISERTADLVAEYKAQIKIVDGLRVYNDLLEKQIADQAAEIAAMEHSIDQVSTMERQIVPLMVRMIDSLEEFIALDVPFLRKEREERVVQLRQMMTRSNVTAAGKLRRILEAYQIENEYGRTIEVYKGTIWTQGNPREAEFLRIGRTTLIYRSMGGEQVGVWNAASRNWELLPASEFGGQLTKGLRIARKQMAPELLVLPVPAPENRRPR